jgi:hypothetical protein
MIVRVNDDSLARDKVIYVFSFPGHTELAGEREIIMKILSTGIFCFAAFFATQASATIVTGEVTFGSGSFIKLSVPFTDSNPDNTVGNNTFQNTNLYGFDEGQNINILSDLNVEVLADGSGGSSGSGTIAAGTLVASHYIFFDPNQSAHQEGSVTFDSDILGILTSTSSLLASDSLINTGVTYQNPSLRGLEAGDSVSIIGLKMISVDWTASTPGDYVRVLTAFSPGAVPVPAAVWLFGTALIGFVGMSRRRKLA